MASLVIDTCLKALTLGVRLEDGTTVSVSDRIGIGHAERIGPAFRHVLFEARIEPEAIKRIGVTVGPGSFMGQRVGISFAKGLALGSGAETVGVTTLEAIAATAGFPVAVSVDARRGEAYVQAFGADGTPEDELRLIPYTEALAWLSGRDRVAGNGAAACGFEGDVLPIETPLAEAMLDLIETLPSGAIQTLYLRDADAKPPSKPAL
ncbi:tRNA (adenosine(37)-N6)-threonylcarbamoyltransferase complex dimerization subunit type 1 TsaB [Parvularcula sp. ZS-1/3]|uniref:tRNA (Adenosine(37)-N6)-threonylcarbamoyltransferase complex dimerization subunit type 1 TsaB n=1 Tax=Parvularcula mediterranea TaxID=2732508 RepID=A0A7Y3W513_9PROT|nr:tRNA (adenosine(37)-N6)-threonylcarbamoyltransferase complex dimerization subunit type 1 TsaB [Parvularcula mediterranea]NNU15756.1 tRNA (adenosine(37)-N6)-threonylcarbamoyltransferase complex dimerization subunit type 1 TsaB [Parvularcula mediterranea]